MYVFAYRSICVSCVTWDWNCDSVNWISSNSFGKRRQENVNYTWLSEFRMNHTIRVGKACARSLYGYWISLNHVTWHSMSSLACASLFFCLFTFRMAFVYAVSRLKLDWCTFSFGPNFRNNADKTHAICFWSILLLWQREQTLQISTRAQHEHRMEDSFDDLHLRWKEHIVRIERREAKKKHHIV